jgi:nicotinamidase/pyrazinamidase
MLQTIRNYTYRTAFIVVDVQYDFLQDGALSITDANSVIPIINQTRAYLSSKVNALTVFTKDFHPVDHVSFQNNNIGSQLFETITLPNGVKQIIWPAHCVQGTLGSELHPHLYYKETDRVFLKGTKRDHDSYSGFGSPNMKDENTGLLNYLRSKWVSSVVIV